MSPVTLASCFSKFDCFGFFLMGFVKDIGYGEKVQNANEMCDRNTRAAQSITNEMLVSTWRETEYRLDVCRDTNGAHIEMY
jgi:hypothetical protein